MRNHFVRAAGGFALIDSGLSYRAKIPLTGTTYTDLYTGGNWNVNGTREGAPLGNSSNLGHGLILTASTTSLSRAATTLTGQATVCWWAKAAPATSLGQISTSCVNGGNYYGHAMDVLCTSTDGDEFLTLTGDGTGTGSPDRTSTNLAVPGDLRDSTWHHMCYLFDAEDCPKLYIDGVEYLKVGDDGTSGFVAVTAVSSAWRCNATANNNSTPKAWGSIADVRMYNRQITATEAASIAAGRG